MFEVDETIMCFFLRMPPYEGVEAARLVGCFWEIEGKSKRGLVLVRSVDEAWIYKETQFHCF